MPGMSKITSFTLAYGLLFLFGVTEGTQAADSFLDFAFGGSGEVTTDLGGQDTAGAVAIQADGKIVVAGDSSSSAALARYNPNGTLDASFGSGGRLIAANFSGATAVALQADGKIVITAKDGGHFGLVRFNPDGTLDPSFGSNGRVTTDFGSLFGPDCLGIQADGKIVAAAPLSGNGGVIVARFNANGTLDNSFGTMGKATASTSGQANSLAIQKDGKIVLAGMGYSQTTSPTSDFALVRLNASGTLDSTFGSGGKVYTDFAASFDNATAVAIQLDGKIVAAGYTQLSGTAPTIFGVARYNPNGSLDTAFGTSGKVKVGFSVEQPGAENVCLSAGIQPDGKILAAGYTRQSQPGSRRYIALARFDTDGDLDSTFGNGGKVITATSNPSAEGYALAVQANGKIVVAGRGVNTGRDFVVVRYNPEQPQFSLFFVPIVISAAGLNNSFFTSELTATNRTGQPARFEFNYTESFGGGSGKL